MDFQKMIDDMNQNKSDERAKYHLTYGGLVDALKNAPKDAVFDKRVKGIGSWRGSYIEVALFTEENGLLVLDEEFNGDYKEYDKWAEIHRTEIDKLPTNANELGELLELIIGKDFIGYKGGNFKITRNKPLWLEKQDSNYSHIAVMGIDDKLKLITKRVDDE